MVLFDERKIKIIIIAAILLALAFFAYKTYSQKNNFEFKNPADFLNNAIFKNDDQDQENQENKSEEDKAFLPEKCENPAQRAIAVMIASDRQTRPLSGLSDADMVFEMPVVTDSITRLMAVYRCSFPNEIGSVRSARHDFIDLALAVDAIYAHWGGSHYALDRLKTGVVNELDALRNPYDVFYRKKGIYAPHNGFTSGERLINASQKLGFRMENNFSGYPQESAENTKPKLESDGFKLAIGFPGEFRVEYQYDAKNNSYLRWRGGTKEIDRNNNQQVMVKNIVAMFAESRQIEGQYNDMKLDGQGKAEFYKNGEKIEGIWKRDASGKDPKLYFLDNFGAETKFVQGNIWVEVVQTNQKVEWKQ